MHRTLLLAEQLIARPSVTPLDGECQKLIAERLTPLGFVCETVESGPADFRVVNLWAKRASGMQNMPLAGVLSASKAANNIANSISRSKLLVFAGHTDVVPTGPLEQWTSNPFVPSHRDDKLYGRGASDMKTSIAAFVVAVEEFLKANPNPSLSLAFLLTSDEEGPSVDGTVIMCDWLTKRGEKLDYCIVGEPTSVEKTGDMIKNGRRGTMSGKLTVKGIQGHIAYPHLAENPIHKFAPAMAALVKLNKDSEWDKGNDYFPATTWQISNIHGGTGASNVIPGHAVIDFNFRFSTESTPESLQKRLVDVLISNDLQPEKDFDLQWTVGGLPFLTRPGELVHAVQTAIRAETGLETQLSTTGGTSDGRFIAKICDQVIECGPPNATIHKIDEHIVVADIEPLKNIYRKTMENLEQMLQSKP